MGLIVPRLLNCHESVQKSGLGGVDIVNFPYMWKKVDLCGKATSDIGPDRLTFLDYFGGV